VGFCTILYTALEEEYKKQEAKDNGND